MNKHYFNEIVGLRTYLAVWVAVGHGMQTAGIVVPHNPIQTILLNGHAAVVLFMIVSGFVITNLLLDKQEAYAPYIVRRFFRLYPAYVIAALVGYLVSGLWVDVVTQVPWQGIPGWNDYAQSIIDLDYEVRENLPWHLAAHAVMLHGLIPVEVLDRAAMTFLPAAWSISLEWQFYLVAPLILAATRRPLWLILAAVAALVLLTMHRKGFLGTYQIDASILGASQYFAIGIISRLATGPLSKLTINPLLVAAPAIFLVIALAEDFLPLAIWSIFFPMMLWSRNAGVLGSVFRLATTSRPAMVLGEASYSTYLIHRPIQVLLAWGALTYLSADWKLVLLSQLAAIAIALPLSILLYEVVERPGIRFGSRLARRISTVREPAVSAP